jgi:hypothetical protein
VIMKKSKEDTAQTKEKGLLHRRRSH